MAAKRRDDITLERLRELLSYDPVTGVFTWLVKRGHKRAGDKAGCAATYPNRPTQYVVIGVDGKTYLAHRLAWLYMTGEWPENDVDHEDVDGLNNRWENLRAASGQENMFNRHAYRSSLTGIKGVTFNKELQKYIAQITVDRRNHYLGVFACPKAAAKAYEIAANNLHGDFARTA